MINFTLDKDHPIIISNGNVHLDGILHIPEGATSLVLFVHGSGSSRFSIRNQHVARVFNEGKLATLLFDLFTPEEDAIDMRTRELRFDIEFLASRLINATDWCMKQLVMHNFKIGYFGASTGGGAALVAAAKEKSVVKAVVSRGGRPDLAGEALTQVKVPTLLIVGGNDEIVIKMNQTAMSKMHCIRKLAIVPGATHLFEESGTLEEVARLAKAWFVQYL
jgi:putative phosphoribosyl transferase